MDAPTAERPLDTRRIAGELAGELRRRQGLPPGELGFNLARTLAFQRDPLRQNPLDLQAPNVTKAALPPVAT